MPLCHRTGHTTTVLGFRRVSGKDLSAEVGGVHDDSRVHSGDASDAGGSILSRQSSSIECAVNQSVVGSGHSAKILE